MEPSQSKTVPTLPPGVPTQSSTPEIINPNQQKPHLSYKAAVDDAVKNEENKSSTANTDLIVGVLLALLVIIAVVVFIDSEMETNDYFTSTNDYSQDDLLWGATQENPTWNDEEPNNEDIEDYEEVFYDDRL